MTLLKNNQLLKTPSPLDEPILKKKNDDLNKEV